MIGFAPGFRLPAGHGPRLQVPRREQPRTRVPRRVGRHRRRPDRRLSERTSGRLAIDRAHARARCSTPDDPRPPCRLRTGRPGALRAGRRRRYSSEPAGRGVMIEVLQPGLLSSLQDTGRVGPCPSGHRPRRRCRPAGPATGQRPGRQRRQGLCHRGHPCWAAPAPATRGVDRPDRRAAAAGTRWMASRCRCGARCRCEAGSEIDLGPMAARLPQLPGRRGRHRGRAPGWAAVPRDLNAGLGPLQGRALAAGDTLPTGPAGTRTGTMPGTGRWIRNPGCARLPAPPIAPAACQPHAMSWTDAARNALRGETVFRVDADSNRVGVRLQATGRCDCAKRWKCSARDSCPGTMQLPPGGQPILMLAEHPVTGGYPRIAQLAAADLPRLAPVAARRHGAVRLDRPRTGAPRRGVSATRELDQLCTTFARRLEEGT